MTSARRHWGLMAGTAAEARCHSSEEGAPGPFWGAAGTVDPLGLGLGWGRLSGIGSLYTTAEFACKVGVDFPGVSRRGDREQRGGSDRKIYKITPPSRNTAPT